MPFVFGKVSQSVTHDHRLSSVDHTNLVWSVRRFNRKCCPFLSSFGSIVGLWKTGLSVHCHVCRVVVAHG